MNSTTYGVDEYGKDNGIICSGYVGEIKMFGFAGVPAHCLACDGSLLSIEAYPELYGKLGTQHGGDGVTTFALPTAEDVIYAAGNGRTVGAAVADGLPNITGETGVRPAKESSKSGTDDLYTTVEKATNEGAFLGSGKYISTFSPPCNIIFSLVRLPSTLTSFCLSDREKFE